MNLSWRLGIARHAAESLHLLRGSTGKQRIESVLRLKVAGLAAIEAIIVSVLHQTHSVLAMAQHAKSIASAGIFGLIALSADKFFSHDQNTLSRFSKIENRLGAAEWNERLLMMMVRISIDGLQLTGEKCACYLE